MSFLGMSLAGCVTSGEKQAIRVEAIKAARNNPVFKAEIKKLEKVPERFRACALALVKLPPEADWRADVVIPLLFELRSSELEKSQCLKDLIAWAERRK